MSDRSDIAAALDGLVVDVDGYTVELAAYEQLPDQVAAFSAWPTWVSTVWRSACVAEPTWQVFVALPNSAADAWAETGEALLGPVREALSKVGGVQRAEPVALAVGDAATTVPALAFTITT